MATKTFYVLNTAATSPGWFGSLQDGGTAPTAANTSFGFAPGKLAVGSFCRGRIGASGTSATTQTTSFISGASGPTAGTGATNTTSGDSFRSPQLSGKFASGNWTLNWNMRAGTAGLVGRIGMRVWRSANADGSSATELTSGEIFGSSVTLSTSADTNSAITWAAPAITLNNEYLFFQLEYQEQTSAGSSNADNAFFRVGSTIVTTAWNDSWQASAVLSPSAVMAAQAQIAFAGQAGLSAEATFGGDIGAPADITPRGAGSQLAAVGVYAVGIQQAWPIVGGATAWPASAGLAPVTTFGADIGVFYFAPTHTLAPTTTFGATARLMEQAAAALAPTTTFGATSKQLMALQAGLTPEAVLSVNSMIQRMAGLTTLQPTTTFAVSETQRLAAKAALSVATTFGGDASIGRFKLIAANLAIVANFTAQAQIAMPEAANLSPEAVLAIAQPVQYMAGLATLSPAATFAASETQILAAKASLAPTTTLGADGQVIYFVPTHTLTPAVLLTIANPTQRMAGLTTLSPSVVFTAAEVQQMAAKATLSPSATLSADISSPQRYLSAGLAPSVVFGANAALIKFIDASFAPTTTFGANGQVIYFAPTHTLTPEAFLSASPVQRMAAKASLSASVVLGADATIFTFTKWAASAGLVVEALMTAQAQILMPAKAPTMAIAANMAPTQAQIAHGGKANLAPVVNMAPAATIAYMAAQTTLAVTTTFGADGRVFIFESDRLTPEVVLTASESLRMVARANLAPQVIFGADVSFAYLAAASSMSVAANMAPVQSFMIGQVAANFAVSANMSTAEVQWMLAEAGMAPQINFSANAFMVKQLASGLAVDTTLTANEAQRMRARASFSIGTTFGADLRLIPPFFELLRAETFFVAHEAMLMRARANFSVATAVSAAANLNQLARTKLSVASTFAGSANLLEVAGTSLRPDIRLRASAGLISVIVDVASFNIGVSFGADSYMLHPDIITPPVIAHRGRARIKGYRGHGAAVGHHGAVVTVQGHDPEAVETGRRSTGKIKAKGPIVIKKEE